MNVFSIEQLIGVLQNLKRPVSSLLDRYFPTVITFESEAVDVDVVPGKRRIAPLVSPLVEGHVVEAEAQTVNTIKPAYVKAKTRFNPQRAMKRAVGERIGGSLTNQQRADLILAQDLEMLTNMVTRRKELMASITLRTGKITLSGAKYPSTLVDFQRANGNTIADLTTTARWGDSAPKILKNLEDWALIGLKATGAGLTDVIMGVDAWQAFKEDSKVEKRLLQINAAGTMMERTAVSGEGLQFKGTLDGMNIYVYAGWYVDPDTGTETEVWPSKSVCVTTPLVEGQQLHGAIQDVDAGLRALEFFPKQWKEQDPSALWTMVQSAPLVVPQRTDASVYCSNVIDA